MKEMRTVILAAGKGVRMKSDIPKVLHRLGGRPIIHYVLDIAAALRSLKTFVVVGHRHQSVRDNLPEEINTVVQRRLLGTADAVRILAPRFKHYGGDVLILCGDAPLLTPAAVKRLVRRHRRRKADCTVLTAVISDPSGYGRIIRNAGGRISAIQEHKELPKAAAGIKEINTGVYCFKSRRLFSAVKRIRKNRRKGEFYLTDIIGILNREGAVIEGVRLNDANEGWGINSRVDLAMAEGVMHQRRVKALMNKGVTVTDPDTTFIGHDVRVGRDSVIRPFTVIESDVRIGRRCVIGPFCHLREDTRIGDDVEVGNHTEISRTRVGRRCFVKHFSFLGDTRMADGVNIGAGVVTANFDGRDKHRTIIRGGAFIGSDSVLVAPVKIGRKAKTGAGCVVTGGTVVGDGETVAGVPAKRTTRSKR